MLLAKHAMSIFDHSLHFLSATIIDKAAEFRLLAIRPVIYGIALVETSKSNDSRE
jgi:hypothetical protein